MQKIVSIHSLEKKFFYLTFQSDAGVLHNEPLLNPVATEITSEEKN